MTISIIVDNGSCADVASSLLVHYLALTTTKHPCPYILNWFNDGSSIKVTRQVLIPFKIGAYVDEGICDVAPMHSSHLLLGRPWQFDRRAIHDGFRNTFKLEHLGHKFLIPPLPPHQVYEDQRKLEKACTTFKITSQIEKKDEWCGVKKLTDRRITAIQRRHTSSKIKLMHCS